MANNKTAMITPKIATSSDHDCSSDLADGARLRINAILPATIEVPIRSSAADKLIRAAGALTRGFVWPTSTLVRDSVGSAGTFGKDGKLSRPNALIVSIDDYVMRIAEVCQKATVAERIADPIDPARTSRRAFAVGQRHTLARVN